MNFRKWCRKCDLWESALLSIFGGSLTFQIPDIPSPQCWIHSHTKEKGQAVKWTPSNWEQLIAPAFCVVSAQKKRWEMETRTISKLLWESFVRPWDLLVPQFDRKQTNQQYTWDQKQTNNLPGIFESHSLADFWDLAVLVQWWKRPKNKHDNANNMKKMDQFWDLWTLMISIQWWPPEQGTCRPTSPLHRLAFFPGQSRPPNLKKDSF